MKTTITDWCFFLLPALLYIAIQILLISVGVSENSVSLLIMPFVIFFFLKRRVYDDVHIKLAAKDFLLILLIVCAVTISTLCATMKGSGDMMSDASAMGIMAAAIAAPVNEEIIYRGIMYVYGRKIFGAGFSALITSLLFAVGHGEFPMILLAFCFGISLCFLYQKYKSILMAIGVHVAVNSALTIGYMFA